MYKIFFPLLILICLGCDQAKQGAELLEGLKKHAKELEPVQKDLEKGAKGMNAVRVKKI